VVECPSATFCFLPAEIEAEARAAQFAVAMHEQKEHGWLVLKA
jgi:hypothetical protein